jgi:hypothetical protein
MVSQQALRQTLRPDVHVNERTLTILTGMDVDLNCPSPENWASGGRPTRNSSARELTTQPSLESMSLVRDLYRTCL